MDTITLDILLPARPLLHAEGVTRVSADTLAGSVGILPHRLDFIAAVRQGILAYATANDQDAYVALDRGVIVKQGLQVRVSVRRALAGADLAQLRAAVDREFRVRSGEERELADLLAKLESAFLSRLSRLRHG